MDNICYTFRLKGINMTDNSGPKKYWETSYPGWYILKYRKPIRCTNIRKLHRTYEHIRVRRTYLPNNTFVSTVFLSLDHQYGNGPPLLFETMINVNGEFLDYQTRCSTWREALKMHWKAVEFAKDII